MSLKSNEIADLATRYINTTQRHVFLTGKAGTGKTTFLHQIINNTYKKAVVAAPTGIAAINAGGVTLHSLLQLPFGAFVPNHSYDSENNFDRINTPHTVLSNFRINRTKRKLLQELELLIIDEVSMLRSDLLDCIDTILRHVRRNKNIPFGGVQILFIGDLLQLPPVVKETEQKLLAPYYESNFFFAAHALKGNPPIYIELDKIYRQSEQAFINILNRFRTNSVTTEDVDLLNTYYQPDINQANDDNYILLTTHNYKADDKNKKTLAELPGKEFKFSAEIEGDFPESMFPASEQLVLKKGAQVMFLKNDSSEEKSYFNGKIGEVTELDSSQIEITCQGNDSPIIVKSHKWENIRYTLNKDTNEIEEKFIGSFNQFPLKLAWAITVHKSQGLTFERAILDLSSAFAAGQVYVALSRLTSLKGLILSSRISGKVIAGDAAVKSFSNEKKEVEILKGELKNDRKIYIQEYGSRTFNFYKLTWVLKKHLESFDKEENKSEKQQYEQWNKAIYEQTLELKAIADNFIKEIKFIVTQKPNYLEKLNERINKAKDYFDLKLSAIRQQIKKHLDELSSKSKVKQYSKDLVDIEAEFYAHQQSIMRMQMMLSELLAGRDLNKEQLKETELYKERQATAPKKPVKTAKKDKTPTKEITYNLYKDGFTLVEIASKRNLVIGTIAGHLCHYIAEGTIDVTPFIDKEKLVNILTVSNTIKSDKMTEIKSKLGNEYTFTDIKFAMAHKSYKKE